MNKEEIQLFQLKQNVINNLKKTNLTKKDRDFLLDLIKLFDSLAKSPDEAFIPSLVSMINKSELEQSEELDIRLRSLIIQLERSKFTEIRHFSYFSFYIQKEKIDIYIKKITANWDLLLSEIKKTEFEKIYTIVYKSVSKKEKILNKKLNKTENWEKKLTDTLDTNICVNVHIILYFKKEKL